MILIHLKWLVEKMKKKIFQKNSVVIPSKFMMMHATATALKMVLRTRATV